MAIKLALDWIANGAIVKLWNETKEIPILRHSSFSDFYANRRLNDVCMIRDAAPSPNGPRLIECSPDMEVRLTEHTLAEVRVPEMDFTLPVDKFAERYLAPAIGNLANRMKEFGKPIIMAHLRPLPEFSMCTASGDGVSIRVSQKAFILQDYRDLTFDILYGSPYSRAASVAS